LLVFIAGIPQVLIMDNKFMYNNPGIKTTQVLFGDNKFMYNNPGIKTTQVLIVDNKFMYKIPAIKTTQVLIMDNKLTIRTGVVFISGFLYMSSFHHRQLDYSHSRYIAPLMADFDTIANDSDILFRDDGTFFFYIQ
jgi:hypothetical protein